MPYQRLISRLSLSKNTLETVPLPYGFTKHGSSS